MKAYCPVPSLSLNAAPAAWMPFLPFSRRCCKAVPFDLLAGALDSIAYGWQVANPSPKLSRQRNTIGLGECPKISPAHGHGRDRQPGANSRPRESATRSFDCSSPSFADISSP